VGAPHSHRPMNRSSQAACRWYHRRESRRGFQLRTRAGELTSHVTRRGNPNRNTPGWVPVAPEALSSDTRHGSVYWKMTNLLGSKSGIGRLRNPLSGEARQEFFRPLIRRIGAGSQSHRKWPAVGDQVPSPMASRRPASAPTPLQAKPPDQRSAPWRFAAGAQARAVRHALRRAGSNPRG
jgi:hypothetical protein